MNDNNSNANEGQIRDLSNTIIANRPSTSTNLPTENVVHLNSANSSAVSEEITPEVRDLVVDEALSVQKTLQEQVRNMVQCEMRDIRKSLGDLMKIVGDLSKNTARSNQITTTNNVCNNNVSDARVTEHYHVNPPSVELNAIPRNSRVQAGQNLSGYSQNSTPMSIPALPTRTVYSNFVSEENCNANQVPRTTGIQFNTNFCENIIGSLPLNTNFGNNQVPNSYAFGNNNVPNTLSVPNIATRSELPKMWIRIDKWGLIFDGNNLRMSVEDFIFRIERLQAQYDIPTEELERDFHLLLSSSAKDWYWLFVQTHVGVKWPGLKQALLSQYQTSR
ncbi:hypothetical protein CVS40_10489 [Lucilia cuprina]|nr:hypothetical protein CVS40_10489 [Lucilia cuprina]